MNYYLLSVRDLDFGEMRMFMVTIDKVKIILDNLDEKRFVVEDIQGVGYQVEADYTVLLKKEKGLEIG